MTLESWGRYPKSTPIDISHFAWKFDPLPETPHTVIAHGQGRSYGDACLNNSGMIISTKLLNRLVTFDQETGLLTCESGMSLAEILKFTVPLGWFLPVTPGTKFVSIGGAIANDIHGKNHHVAGSFGHHVVQFELLRSTGERITCSPTDNKEYFYSTIGGLGLTGLITWASIRLKKIPGPYIKMDSIKFSSLKEFFELSKASDQNSEYTVAWLDCVASGDNFGRGIFMRGDHAQQPSQGDDNYKSSFLSVPFDFPSWALNPLSVRAFNTLYYNKQSSKSVTKTCHYDPFFYPLDSVAHWNRIYGKNGFVQFQCVVPKKDGSTSVDLILKEVVSTQSASFLAVLKEFGSKESIGLMSFPREGITLCLDFAFKGEETLRLFARLHKIVFEHDGAIYPAKDACMTKDEFSLSFPKLDQFKKFVDPKFSSDLWKRVTT